MKTKITVVCMLLAYAGFAQSSGNVNYQKQISYPQNNINVGFPSGNDIIISVKGMANVKADSYVAIFNIHQTGKNTEEVNKLIDDRIQAVEEKIKGKPNVSMFVDMLTFVPLYEYEVERKIFSKKTYNEVPAGFEVKKNIHIEFKDPNFLNELIAVCSENEIYDLVRVDYFSNTLETVKKELMKKAKLLLKEKQANYKEIIDADFTVWDKQFGDGFIMHYPTEMYKTYQAYSSSSLTISKRTNVSQAEKSKTLYYQPIVDKEFDFVVNPQIVEPVIQVLYEIKLKLTRPKEEEQKQAPGKTEKEYFIVTPNGDVRNLDLN